MDKLAREANRDSTAKYRQAWKDMDIVAINLYVPKHIKGYFQAIAKVVQAEEILVQIEKRDPELLEVLADRQVRVGVTHEELTDNINRYRDHGGDSKLKDRFKEATNILTIYKSIGEAKVATIEASAARPRRYEDEVYWQAREYAACMYVQGAVELFAIRESGIELPEHIEL